MSKPSVLHPDYLVDRGRRGALGAAEQQRLEAHLAACGVCAWEMRAMDDFARVRGAALEEAVLARLVDATLARVEESAARPEPRRAPAACAPLRAPRREGAATARWITALAMVAVAAVVVLLALPSRGARDGSRAAPALHVPSEAALDAGATESTVGSDS